MRKKISELTAITGAAITGYVEANDLFEVEVAAGGDSKKATLTKVLGSEAAARIAQDNVIEASCGLQADGSYVPYVGSNYMGASTDIIDATGLLDAQIKANTDALAGMGMLTSKIVTVSAAEILGINTVDKTLIASQGADTVIEVISCFAHLLAGATPFANGADVSVTYSGNTAALFNFDKDYILSASCEKFKGVEGAEDDMKTNTAVVLKQLAATAFTAGTGTLKIYIIYRVVTLVACPV